MYRARSVPASILLPVALAALHLFPGQALAEDECASLNLPNPVYGIGGSASMKLLGKVAGKLRTAASPLTIFYAAPGACAGITPYVDGTPITGSVTYWEADGETAKTCTLPAQGIVPDFGMMGVQGTLCSGVDAIPAGIGEFLGPITSWSLIARNDSSQTSISAQAVYFAYGFGASLGQVSPWTVDAELYSRNATSAALIAVALGAGIPPSRFNAVNDVKSNQGMVDALLASTNPEAAIGFVSTEFADKNRGTIHTLAFQAYDQQCAYWPDSTATATDKRNVRDGHYYLWSPYRFYVPVDNAGQIIDPETRQFIGYFSGDVPAPADVPILDIEIQVGNIPQCAMRVTRTEEIGPLSSIAPADSCACYYELKATGTTDCQACTDSSQCPSESPTCRLGYCEIN